VDLWISLMGRILLLNKIVDNMWNSVHTIHSLLWTFLTTRKTALVIRKLSPNPPHFSRNYPPGSNSFSTPFCTFNTFSSTGIIDLVKRRL
jgi:hypothetical protein